MQPTITPTAKKKFQATILERYAVNKRDLPWRETCNPYAILVSEVMSQQTQVSRVIPKWHQWMYDFPTVEVLAEATLVDVLAHWSGLGYNRRGKALWEAGKKIVVDMESGHPVAQWIFDSAPKILVAEGKKAAAVKKMTLEGAGCAPTADEIVGYLRMLPGIGEYTASAVATFAYNMDVAVVDINVTRVLRHTFALPEVLSVGEFRAVATSLIPLGRSREWHNALMDYGATVLHSKATGIGSAKQSKFVGSDREVRGWILKQLTKGFVVTMFSVSEQFPEKDVEEIVRGLVKDGMVRIGVKGELEVVS